MPQGWRVRCRVTNESARPAEQVVLTVGLTDGGGRMLAANPLAGVAELAEGEARDVSLLVPLRESVTNVHAIVEVSLVRWR